MATTPAFAATPRAAVGIVSTANTARDGTGTMATIFTAGANGSRIERVKVKAIETTAASLVRLFVHDGSVARLIEEIPVGAVTVSATQGGFEADLSFADPSRVLVLPAGWSLRAATHTAQQLVVAAFGGDF